MTRLLSIFLVFILQSSTVVSEDDSNLTVANENNQSVENLADRDFSDLAYVIPIRDQIGPPILSILRRGLKSAINRNAKVVILDMDTPGGELGVTLEIMQEIIEAIERFDGSVITYVNKEAISAGAYIAIATSEIAFSPMSQIGAAEAVSGGGGNIDSSMKRKLNSYLKAKIRNYAGDYRYRGKVMAAMMDANESLIIEGQPLLAKDGSEIKKMGELLTLTGEEASQLYGEPPQPLLGIGIFQNIEELLDEKFGSGNYSIDRMKINWAEKTGLWLNGIAPIILGIGMVCLFIEFKTPGFGVFGALGIILLLIFFGSKFVAGLAGQEELLIFLIGVCLIAVEVFLVPGLILPGILGLAMMIGAIFWAMVDVWPTQDYNYDFSNFRTPTWELLQAFGVAVILGLATSKILPRTSLWGRMVLSETVGGSTKVLNSDNPVSGAMEATLGQEGKCVSELFPSGEVDIGGRRYDARSRLSKIEKGEKIRVVEISDFGLVVEKINS